MKRLILLGLVGILAAVVVAIVSMPALSAQDLAALSAPVLAAGPEVESAAVIEMAAITAPAARLDISAATADLACRGGGSGMELCLRANRTGLMRVDNGFSLVEYYYAFYDVPGQCPSAPEGYVERVTDWATTDLQFMGYSAEDFTTYGMGAYYCSFAPAS